MWALVGTRSAVFPMMVIIAGPMFSPYIFMAYDHAKKVNGTPLPTAMKLLICLDVLWYKTVKMLTFLCILLLHGCLVRS